MGSGPAQQHVVGGALTHRCCPPQTWWDPHSWLSVRAPDPRVGCALKGGAAPQPCSGPHQEGPGGKRSIGIAVLPRRGGTASPWRWCAPLCDDAVTCAPFPPGVSGERGMRCLA